MIFNDVLWMSQCVKYIKITDSYFLIIQGSNYFEKHIQTNFRWSHILRPAQGFTFVLIKKLIGLDLKLESVIYQSKHIIKLCNESVLLMAHISTQNQRVGELLKILINTRQPG